MNKPIVITPIICTYAMYGTIVLYVARNKHTHAIASKIPILMAPFCKGKPRNEVKIAIFEFQNEIELNLARLV